MIEFHLTVFDLRELAAEVIAEMRLSFEKAGAVLQLTARMAYSTSGVTGSHWSSVISNLLDNALKYGKDSSGHRG